MKKIDPVFAVLGALSIVQLAASIAICPSLPETIPFHWNASGQVDNWASRPWSILLAAFPLVMIVLAAVIPRLDPKSENYERHWPSYRLIMAMVTILMASLYWMTIAISLDLWNPDVSRVVPAAIGVLFIVIGNYLPRVRHNYTLGIRLPWTLASERVWTKTHRFGGALFIIIGLVLVAGVFISPTARFVSLIFGLAVLIGATSLYSWILWKKEQKGEKKNTD